MAARPVPSDGDVIVREESRDGGSVYVLRTAPGPDQLVIAGHDQAVEQALAFAKRQGVRAWMMGEHDPVLLTDVPAAPAITGRSHVAAGAQQTPR